MSRSVSSSPAIIPKGQSFGAICDDEEPKFIGRTEKPCIVSINFGNGPAIDVEVDWELPDQEILKVLQTYDPHNEYKVELVKTPFADDLAMKLYWNHFIERQKKEILEPILPHPSSEPTEIKLPPYYIEAFHLYLRLAVHSRPEKKKAFDIEPFPKAEFTLNYQDLAGESYSKKFSVSLTYDHNATHGVKEEHAYAAYLQVTSEKT